MKAKSKSLLISLIQNLNINEIKNSSLNKYSSIRKLDLLPKFNESEMAKPKAFDFTKFLKSLCKSNLLKKNQFSSLKKGTHFKSMDMLKYPQESFSPSKSLSRSKMKDVKQLK